MNRPPRTALEAVVANFRPQPAIPAALVLLLTTMGAMSAAGGDDAWAGWLIGAGILASCGLAIAAGFCSLAPPVAWLALAYVSLGLFGAAPGGRYLKVVILLCGMMAIAMVGLQLWRVSTGRFVPTIDEVAEPDA